MRADVVPVGVPFFWEGEEWYVAKYPPASAGAGVCHLCARRPRNCGEGYCLPKKRYDGRQVVFERHTNFVAAAAAATAAEEAAALVQQLREWLEGG